MKTKLVVACIFLIFACSASAADLRLGVAAVRINPPPGTPLAGYYYARPSEEVLDDIFAKAMVLESEGSKVALVVCDLLSIPRPTVVEARRLIEELTRIPTGHVMISATHQHTGPVVSRESQRDELDGGASEPARRYTAGLPKLIAEAVQQANARLAPARPSAAVGREERLSFNRRYWMRDGSVGWNPGKLNPAVLRPAGPIDPELGVLYFESTDARPMLTYVSFALHPDTTGGTRISADYPGVLARRLGDYKGEEMLTILANGACGNVNHLNIHWAARQSSPAEAKRIGTVLAAAVLKAYMDLKPISNGPIQVRSETVRLPLAQVQPADLEEAQAVVKLGRSAKFMDQVKAYKVLDIKARNGQPLEAEIQVISLGSDIAWISIPGEAFVELGLSIKAVSPFKHTFIVELANGALGYIPNKPAYAEGNYEVVSARCAEGSGEMLVAAAIKMLEELHSGTAAR